MNKRQWLAVVAANLLIGGCATSSAPITIPDAVAAQSQLSTFTRLAKEAGLDSTLNGAGPYTVFAPSDAAFQALPEKTMAALKGNKEGLTSLLSFHVVPGKMASAEVKNGAVTTVQGGKLSLATAGSFVTVEDAVVTQADLPAANGVVHIIDRVLTPPPAKK